MTDLTKFLTSDFIRIRYRNNYDSSQMFTKKKNVYTYEEEELKDMNTPFKKKMGKDIEPTYYRDPLCMKILYNITLKSGRVYENMRVSFISANSPYIKFVSSNNELEATIKITDIARMDNAGIYSQKPSIPSVLVVNSKYRKDLLCHLVEIDYNISPVVSTTLVFEENGTKQLIEIPLEHIRRIAKRRN